MRAGGSTGRGRDEVPGGDSVWSGSGPGGRVPTALRLPAYLPDLLAHSLDLRGEAGMLVHEVHVHVGERLDQPAGVVAGERAREGRGVPASGRAQPLDCADLTGDLAELGGVLPCPRRHRAVSGARVTCGLDPFLTGQPCVL